MCQIQLAIMVDLDDKSRYQDRHKWLHHPNDCVEYIYLSLSLISVSDTQVFIVSNVCGILRMLLTACFSWWRHQVETFSALLAICAWNSPVPGEFPAQRPVTQIFDVFFDLRLNKRLSKQPWGWRFDTPSWSLWRQCNVYCQNRLKEIISTNYHVRSYAWNECVVAHGTLFCCVALAHMITKTSVSNNIKTQQNTNRIEYTIWYMFFLHSVNVRWKCECHIE